MQYNSSNKRVGSNGNRGCRSSRQPVVATTDEEEAVTAIADDPEAAIAS